MGLQSYLALFFLLDQLLQSSRLLEINLLLIVMRMGASQRVVLANAAVKRHASVVVQKGMLVHVINISFLFKRLYYSRACHQ